MVKLKALSVGLGALLLLALPVGTAGAQSISSSQVSGVVRDASGGAAVVVAAWGVHGAFIGRHEAVRKALPRLHYLRLTKGGHPGHPLYLPKTLQPVAW